MRVHRRDFIKTASAGTVPFAMAGCLGNSVPDDAVSKLAAPVRGDENAPVSVEVYEDFACPHCRTYNQEIAPTLIQEYVEPGIVSYKFQHFPLPVGQWSWPAAMVAASVYDRAGDSAFWTIKDALFANQGNNNYEQFERLVDEIGLNGASVVADARNNKYRPAIEADKQEGTGYGVQGTPGFVINGEFFRPDSRSSLYAQLTSRIESAR